jgi:Ca2+/Na+ antiporter
MATVIANKKVSRFQVYNGMVVMMLFYVFAMLVMKDEVTYQEQVITELKNTEYHATPAVWSSIDNRARNRHQKYLYSSGAYGLIKKWFLPKENDSPVNATFSGKWNYRAVMNVQVLFFQVMHRLSAIEHWAVELVSFSFAVIFWGYNKWRAGHYRLGGASVNRVRLWLKLLWLSIAMIFTFLVTPNFFGAYTYYAPAIFIVVLAFAVSKLIQSFNKSF